MPTLAEGDGVHVFWEGDGLPLDCPVALYTEEEGDGLTLSGLGVTVTVLLVEGVRPGDGVARSLALTGLAVPQLGVACPEGVALDPVGVPDPRPLGVADPAPEGDPVTVYPLQVAHPLGETEPDHVTPLGVA